MFNANGDLKFVDLEHLHRDGDYILDYALLIEDIALYRDLPLSEDIVTQIPGAETDELAPRFKDAAVQYPMVAPSKMALLFQAQLIAQLEEYAAQIEDSGWKARLWLATARALTLLSVRRFISPTQIHRGTDEWGRVAMLYAETIRLLDELFTHLETGEPLPDLPFNETVLRSH